MRSNAVGWIAALVANWFAVRLICILHHAGERLPQLVRAPEAPAAQAASTLPFRLEVGWNARLLKQPADLQICRAVDERRGRNPDLRPPAHRQPHCPPGVVRDRR